MRKRPGRKHPGANLREAARGAPGSPVDRRMDTALAAGLGILTVTSMSVNAAEGRFTMLSA